MKTLEYFFNEYIFLGNALISLCYLQTNMLMLRFLFIAGNIFFLIYSLTIPIINIDSVLFNIAFLIINISLSVPLVKSLIPPHFNKEQREIFKEHFKNYLTPKEVHILLSYHRRKIYRVTSQIEKIGNEFSSIYFIVKIGKNCNVYLKSKKRSFTLHNYSWIGIPEYLNLISRKDSLLQALKEFDTGEWGANFYVNVDPTEDNHNETHLEGDNVINIKDKDHTIMDDDNVIVIYEFDLRNIDKIIAHHNGMNIMRGLHSIWLKYCSEIVRQVDQTNLQGNVTANISGRKNKTFEEINYKKNMSSDFILESPMREKEKNYLTYIASEPNERINKL